MRPHPIMEQITPRLRLRTGRLAHSPFPFLSLPLLLLLLLAAACQAACPLPTITTQPQSQTACSGGSATFGVSAFSAGCTVSYLWYGPQGLISGATSTNYTINPVSAGNAGIYYAVASVIGSSRQSTNATLTVNVSPSITSQPQSVVINIGATAIFTVFATGTPAPSYQWHFNGTNSLTGATSSSYTISSAQPSNGGIYSVVVSNTCGSATSSNAILTVYTPYTFATLAGCSAVGSADGTGSAARFYNPGGVAVDSNGNVYVADTENSTIRKVTPAGVVTTLAGLAGSSGSADGTGSAARFEFPAGVAVDSSGNVYVADTWNSAIRKLTPVGTNWVVTTLAGLASSIGSADGTGSAARFDFPSSVAVDSSGNVYVADSDNFTIRKVAPVGTN